MLDGFKDSDWGPCSKLSPKEVFCMPGTWSDVITREEFDNDRAKVFRKMIRIQAVNYVFTYIV
jgi:hypothetical protein